MNIREASRKDIGSICHLSNEINTDHYRHMPRDFVQPDGSSQDKSYWSGFFDDRHSCVFVAEHNDNVIGLVAVRVSSAAPYPFLISRPRGHVATIVVTKSFQGKGVGRKLMQAAEVFAKEQGAEDIKLEVMAFNSGALEFYREIGYGHFSYRLCKLLD